MSSREPSIPEDRALNEEHTVPKVTKKKVTKIDETTLTPVIPVTAITRVPAAEGEHCSDFTATPSNETLMRSSLLGRAVNAVVSQPAPASSKSVLSGLVKNVPTNPPHVVVVARAGTGKTTTLVEGLKALKGLPTSITPSVQQQAVWDQILLSKSKCRSVCFAAFNKSIAEELKKRVPEGCEASTLHSMGFSAVRRKFGKAINVKESRVDDIACKLLGMERREVNEESPLLLARLRQLVSLCKVNLLDGTTADLDALCDRYDIEFGDRYERDEAAIDKMDALRYQVFGVVRLVLDLCKRVQDDLTIDYDDMIWIPVVLDLPCWRHDLLLVDEAQDMNRCQQALAKKCGDRLILVGDDMQAIYGFAGADSESIPRMTDELKTTGRGCVVLPLTVTRRCGRAIVKEANRYVADFAAHESNCEGKVLTKEMPLVDKTVKAQREEDTYLPLVQPGDMLICRANAPLVSQCFKLLKRGVRAFIVGKADVAQGIISLITKLDAQSVPELVKKVEEWATTELDKENAKQEPKETKLDRIADRRECVLAFCEDMLTVRDVVKRVEQLFTEVRDAVRLSSIHKAKGLEAKRVFFLAPGGFKPPHPRSQPWERQQELNMRYVGVTRAIEELVYVF
jgi:superfamily I DNA/RNA helicase